jgi:RNA polymerase sigma factor (sigma-70 family)
MNFQLFYIYLSLFFYNINGIVFIQKYLSKYQWSLIHTILTNPTTDDSTKKKTQQIIYTFYDQWAFTQAYKFKQLHKYKCQHISTIELYSYASIGLYKSIQSYNPKYNFINYANIYIQSELLKGLTDLHPISLISKGNRKKGYSIVKKEKSKVQYIGNNDWILDKTKKNKVPFDNIIEMNNNINVWETINTLSPFQKSILEYKYNFYFEKIRSNKEIAELMSCSEEWIRINIKKSLLSMKNNVK